MFYCYTQRISVWGDIWRIVRFSEKWPCCACMGFCNPLDERKWPMMVLQRGLYEGLHNKSMFFSIFPLSFGYPDPTYLVRVTEELREKGITADWWAKHNALSGVQTRGAVVVFPDPPAFLSLLGLSRSTRGMAISDSCGAIRKIPLFCTILDICYVPLSCVQTSSSSDVIASPSAIQWYLSLFFG